MPCYSFRCTKCKVDFEQNYSFAEFESVVLPKLVPCVRCQKTNKVNQVFTPPNINIGGTIGAQSEKNTKRLGGKIQEEKAKKVEKENKNKPKRPWYGTLSKQKQKDIFSETNEVRKQEKIQKYINTGE